MGMYIGLGVIALLVLFFMGSYNGFVRLLQKVEEAFSTMDVYLKKRYDLIPNIVETVKGYAKHEQETLEKVIKARNAGLTASTVEEIQDSNNIITAGLRQLFALSESYPELKANENFLALQSELTGLEDEIAQSRKYYNAVVRIYNTRCAVLPHNIIASLFNFVKRPYFQVDDTERQNVQVRF